MRIKDLNLHERLRATELAPTVPPECRDVSTALPDNTEVPALATNLVHQRDDGRVCTIWKRNALFAMEEDTRCEGAVDVYLVSH